MAGSLSIQRHVFLLLKKHVALYAERSGHRYLIVSKSWHLYAAPESQRNATTAPGGVHDCPNNWVFTPLKRVQWRTAVTRRWWQEVPPCGLSGCGRRSRAGPPTSVGRSDTSSRCRPQSRTSLNFLRRHAVFLQIWRWDAVDAFGCNVYDYRYLQ